MKSKDIFVMDNNGVTDGPFKTQAEAMQAVVNNVREGFKYTGNVWVAELLEPVDMSVLGN